MKQAVDRSLHLCGRKGIFHHQIALIEAVDVILRDIFKAIDAGGNVRPGVEIAPIATSSP